MPDGPTTAWDGHGPQFGVDTRTHPSQLAENFCTSAVNRKFRGGRNSTRPPIQQKALSFDSPTAEEMFRHGNIQGCHAYEKTLPGTQPHLVLAAGEKMLKCRMYGDSIQVSVLTDLPSPEYMHAWFVQAENRLYYQNGVDRPIGWDGGSPAYVLDAGEDTMPVGTIMAYIHGRIAVFTSSNHCIISDHIYGNGVNNTRGAESFIEFQQFGDIGVIPTPFMLGEVTGAIPVPKTPNRNAQGELLVLCRRGGYALDTTRIRETWFAEDIQQIVLVGIGGASDKSVVAANNDVWFRTSEREISSYKFERADQDKEWGDTSLSREVDDYLHLDTPRNLQFCSCILARNRLLTTCAHRVLPNDISGYGHHRFGQGIVSLDFDRGSTVNRKPGFAWDGLWTGVNPVQLVSLTVDQEIRPLVVSRDEDGENRVYEIMPDGYHGSDMANGTQKKIVSFYHLPYLFDQRDAKNRVVGKRLTGARVEVSDVVGKASVSLSYRPDYSPCWRPLSDQTTVGHEPESLDAPTDQKPFHAIFRVGGPEEDDCDGANLAYKASFFQARVEIEGEMTVDQLMLVADVFNEPVEPACADEDWEPHFSKPVTCPEPNLFDYKIAQ